MDKHQLAKELRQRQYDKGIIEKRIIDALSDNEIIDAYITCSHCGEKKVNEQDLETAINIAQNANQFFQRCDGFADVRHSTTAALRNESSSVAHYH